MRNFLRGHIGRTTSACAENTCPRSHRAVAPRNYLRVRGEYAWDAIAAGINWELPPRARRIQLTSSPGTPPLGTTSACAENTLLYENRIIDYWNYLRVRGEYWRSANQCARGAELPPRARRIHCMVWIRLVCLGTTSACAENTVICL